MSKPRSSVHISFFVVRGLKYNVTKLKILFKISYFIFKYDSLYFIAIFNSLLNINAIMLALVGLGVK